MSTVDRSSVTAQRGSASRTLLPVFICNVS
jgi:hypothetical protein